MSIHDDVQRELDEARRFDEQARFHRKQAGRLLAQARDADPMGSGWHKGIDSHLAELLIRMSGA